MRCSLPRRGPGGPAHARESGNRFSDKDMRKIKKAGFDFHPEVGSATRRCSNGQKQSSAMSASGRSSRGARGSRSQGKRHHATRTRCGIEDSAKAARHSISLLSDRSSGGLLRLLRFGIRTWLLRSRVVPAFHALWRPRARRRVYPRGGNIFNSAAAGAAREHGSKNQECDKAHHTPSGVVSILPEVPKPVR
jgi:hypothetical protein